MTMPTILDGPSAGVPLRFVVPDQLQEIALGEPPEQRIQRSYETFSTRFQGLPRVQALRMVVTHELALARLIREGAVFVASCVARSEADPSRLTTAQFSILVKEANLHGDRPLVSIAQGLRLPGQPREVIFNRFPAGEAVVVGEELSVTLPASSTGRPVASSHRVRQAQVIFAFPDRRRIAIIGVSSEGIDDWEHYMRLLNGIAHSISFSSPGTSPITNMLDGLD